MILQGRRQASGMGFGISQGGGQASAGVFVILRGIRQGPGRRFLISQTSNLQLFGGFASRLAVK